MSMRFELTGECAAVNLVDAPTEAILNAELKEVFWKNLGHLVKQIPTKELLVVLMTQMHGLGREWKGAMTVGCLEHMT